MLRILTPHGGEASIDDAGDAIWFDLVEPTREEELSVEALVGRDVPTPLERAAMEDSARNYVDGAALFFTPTLLARSDDVLLSGPVTFMLLPDRLVTLRMIHPRAFEVGSGRASARVSEASSGSDIAVALIEGVVERIADLLSGQVGETEALSAALLAEGGRRDLKAALRTIGRSGAISALCHASLSSLQRSLIFLESVETPAALNNERLRVFRHDIEELERQADALQSRISFLQESTLGLISERQTDVLKALSLAAIAFIPATLVASIFGMNFEFMHWYEAPWGPPTAFALMILAPLALFAIARWRRWF